MFKGKKDPRIVAAIAFVAPAILGPAFVKAAAISFDGSTTYTQNFQSMTATTLTPAAISNTTMTEVSGLSGGGSVSGWYVYHQSSGTPRWGRSDGSSGTGSFYAMYDAQSTPNVALGSQGSSSIVSEFGVVLQNTSSSTISSFSISYDAVISRNPTTTANSYPVSYLISSTAPTTSSGTGAGTLNDGAGTWTASSALSFTTPTSGTGAPNATQAAITPMFTIGTKTATISGVTWAAGQYLYIRWKETDESGADSTAGVDNFSLSVPAGVATVVWASTTGNWDTSTGNWTGGSPVGNKFKASDNATFNNTAAAGTHTITVDSAGVSPTSTTIDNDASHSYIFTSSGSVGIASGSLAKSGVGTATLNSQNTYAGGTAINGGTLVVDGGDNRLGAAAGGINFGGGTLRTDTAGLTSARALSVGAAGGTFNTNGFNSSTTGATAINGGVFTKAGSGDLAINGTLAFDDTGSLNVAGGTLTIATTSSTVTMKNGAVIDGDLIINTTARINIDNAAKTYGGAGKIKFLGSALGAGSGSITLGAGGFTNFNALISNLSGDTAGVITSDVVMNPTGTGHVAFAAGSVTTGNYTTASYLMFVGGTNGATGDGLTFNGKISGEGDLFIGNNSKTGGGAANITFNAANDYAGNTLINTGGVIKVGVNNALPSGTNVVFGSLSGAGNAILDLNGKNQQIASLSDDTAKPVGKNLTVTNLGTVDSILTLSGSTSPANAFGGVISDGPTNKVILVKGGTNTITLAGVNTYHGDTTVNDGVLKVTGSIANSAHVNVHGGTLQLDNGTTLGEGTDLFVDGSGMVNLNFTGTFTVGQVFIDGVLYQSGTFDSSNSHFAGDGAITATPEPASLSLIGLAACGLLGRRRRRA